MIDTRVDSQVIDLDYSSRDLPAQSMLDELLKKQKENFDEFKMPPSLDVALKHRSCNLFGKEETIFDASSHVFCPCCESSKQEQYPINTPTNKLNFYGPVIPLFFQLSKFLIIMTVFYSLIGIYVELYIVGANCTQLNADNSLKWVGCPIALSTLIDTKERDKRNSFFNVASYITPMLWLLSITMFVIYHTMEKSLETTLKKKCLLVSEYTVAIYKLKSSELTDSYIRQILNQNLNTNVGEKVALDIAKINIAEYRGNLIDRQLKLKLAESKLEHLKNKIENEAFEGIKKALESRLKRVESEVKDQSGYVDRYKNKLKKNKWNRSENSVAFVTFSTPSEATKVSVISTLEWISSAILPCILKPRSHLILPADEPDDIKWSRVGIDISMSKSRMLVSHLLIWIVIILFLTIQLLSKIAQSFIQKVVKSKIDDKRLVYFLSFPLLPSMVNQILNFVLISIAARLSKSEKHFSISEEVMSLTRKLIWIQFVNTAGFPVALSILSNDYGGIDNITYQIFNSLLTNLWMNPLLHAFSPGFFLTEFWTKRRVENRLIKGEFVEITQKELNDLFEPPEMSMHTRYASIVRTFFVSCFFFDVLPIGMILCLIFMIIQFWVDKYMILRRYKRTNRLSKQLSYGVSWIASSCIFLVVLGHMVNKYVLNQGFSRYSTSIQVIDLAYLTVAYLVSLLNLKYIIRCKRKIQRKASNNTTDVSLDLRSSISVSTKSIDPSELYAQMHSEDRERSYWEIWVDLDKDYDRMNPMTKYESTKNWLRAKFGNTYHEDAPQLAYVDDIRDDGDGQQPMAYRPTVSDTDMPYVASDDEKVYVASDDED